MIGRRRPPAEPEHSEPKSFDDFELKLGDIMRGERATIGKSLLDVQRELKIKATYIAAIENADVSAFETQGFVAGYVRSYARYLGLDPDWAYATFCEEARFVSATALEAGTLPKTGPVFNKPRGLDAGLRDPIAQPRVSFAPQAASTFSQIEPRAVGSILVLLALVGGIGYGGWTVLQEVQRVQVAPVDRPPTADVQVDPVANVDFAGSDLRPEAAGVAASSTEALYRLYRPEPLDAPVMTSRDGAIGGIDPTEFGALARAAQDVPRPLDSTALPVPARPGLAVPQSVPTDVAMAATQEAFEPDTGQLDLPRVTAEALPDVMLVTVGEEVWLQVVAADGSVLKEAIMQPGETFVVPETDVPPTLRAGRAGSVYFSVNGKTYGPAGAPGDVAKNIALSPDPLTQVYAEVDPNAAQGRAQEAVRVAEAAIQDYLERLPNTDRP